MALADACITSIGDEEINSNKDSKKERGEGMNGTEREDTKFVTESECLRNQSYMIGSLQRSRRDIENLLVLCMINSIAIIFLAITYLMK